MGRIDRLEVNNFKSYSGKQVLGPFKDFTCIIGPNGAGKSNVMDAICFVLGIHAAKIRAHKMEDLIFKVEGAAAKTLTASVCMVYVVSRGEVEGLEDGDELLFERSILAGGTTEYTINSNKVQADQYSKGLKELGIDIKARNFLVFQGDVDAVAKKGPKAMRDYFELFCGSGELKEPFEKAEVRLEEARKEQLTRATLRRTTTLEVKDLRAAKEESEKHDALAKEVEALRTRLMLVKLFYLDASITGKEEEAREAADSLGEAMAREGELLGAEKECAKSAATASKTMHKKELQLQAKGGQVRQALEATATIEARIASLRAVAGGGGEGVKAAHEALNAITQEVESLEQEVGVIDKKLQGSGGSGSGSGAAGGEAALDPGAAAYAALGVEDREQYSALKTKERMETADQRDTLGRLGREQSVDDSELASLKGSLEAAQARLVTVTRQLDGQRVRAKELGTGAERVKREVEGKRGELERCSKEITAAQARYSALAPELQAVQSEIVTLQAASSKSEGEKRVERAVEDMKRLFNGVRGRLSDQLTPKSRSYNTALTVALGRLADAVVVNNETAALECIKYLKDNRIRPLVFLPLDSMRSPEVEDHVQQVVSKPGSKLQLARNLVNFSEPDIERAVFMACGSTIVADTLEAAMEVRYGRNLSAKVVTLDGTVIKKNGNITGGGLDGTEFGGGKGGGKGGGGGTRWDEKALTLATEKRDKLLNEEERLRRQLKKRDTAGGEGPGNQSLLVLRETLEYDIRQDQARGEKIASTLAALEATITTGMGEESTLKAEVSRLTPKLAALTTKCEERGSKLAALAKDIARLGDEVFAPFTKRTGIANIRDFESQVLAKAEREAKERAGLLDTLGKLKSKLEYERSREKDAKGELERLNKSVATAGNELRKAEQELKAAAEAKVTLQNELQPLAKELQAAKTEFKTAEAGKEEAYKARKKAGEEKGELAKALAVLESSLERLRAGRHDLLQTAVVEKLALPTKKAAGAGAGAGVGGGGKVAAGGGKGGGGKSKTKGGKPTTTTTSTKGRKSGGGGKKMEEEAEEEEEEEEGGGDDGEEEEEGEGEGEEEEEEGGGGGKKGSGGKKTLPSGTLFSQQHPLGSTQDESSQGGGAPSARFSHGSDAAVVTDKRRSDRVDYEQMGKEDKGLAPDAVEARMKFYEASIGRKTVEMNSLNPSARVGERWEEAEARAKAAQVAWEEARGGVAASEREYNDISRRRQDIFLRAFHKVSDEIDSTYKRLTRSTMHAMGGSAKLMLSNPSEPFDAEGGIMFSAQPPGKKFREITTLSGGEKSIASLALLFSMHACSPSPFFILDEVDAALDAVNVQKVASFIRERSLRSTSAPRGQAALQFLVISLKDSFYSQADLLVGIYRDSAAMCSRRMTLDLSTYGRVKGGSQQQQQQQQQRKAIQEEEEGEEEKEEEEGEEA